MSFAQLIEPFNPAEVDPTQSGGKSFPIGKHPVVLVGSEVRATKNNDGGMLVLALEIIDGPGKGIIGEERLNLYNNSADAVKIAKTRLSAISHAVGVFHLGPTGTDTSLLANKPFIIDVCAQAVNPQYTEIKKIYDINNNEPGKAPVQQQTQQVQQPAATGGWGGAATQVQQPQQPQQQTAANSWQQNATTAAPATGSKPSWAN